MLTEKIVNRDSQQKLYVQMERIILDKIGANEWPAGSQIPTEDELCRQYDVSKATVRTAIAELVRNGWLRKQQGKGTFVTSRAPDRGITMKTKLTEDIFGEGVVTTKELLVRGMKEPPEEVRTHLRTDGPVYYVLCKRVVNGETAYLEESFVPLAVAPAIGDAEVCRTPFFELMQNEAERKIFKVIQMIEIAEMTGDAASILKNGNGSSVLMLHRLLVAADGSPIAYTRLMGGGRKYKLRTELVQLGA